MAISLKLPSGSTVTADGPVVTIGSDPACEVSLPDEPGIHPRHASIKKIANKWMIQSEGDWNLQAGDGPAGRKCWLKSGDLIQLTESGTSIVFNAVEEPTTPPIPSEGSAPCASEDEPPPLPQSPSTDREASPQPGASQPIDDGPPPLPASSESHEDLPPPLPTETRPHLCGAIIGAISKEGEGQFITPRRIALAGGVLLCFLIAGVLLRNAIVESQTVEKRIIACNHFKCIGLAMSNFAYAHECLPPAVGHGSTGFASASKPPVSWRVLLLPYIEEQDLYEQYDFDEPWDGPNNRKLLNKIPPLYRSPGAAGDPTHATVFVITGPETVFPKGDKVTFESIGDSASNTALAVEAIRPVPWTKPEDIEYDLTFRSSSLGGVYPNGFHVLFCDGFVDFVEDTVDDNRIRAMFTKHGDESPIPIPSGSRHLDVRIGTVRDTPWWVHKHFNPSLQDVKCYATEDELVIDFNVDTEKWLIGGEKVAWRIPLLIRLFDRNGHCLTFFTTKEGFTVYQDVYQDFLQRYEDAKRRGVAEHISAKLCCELLKPQGNRLVYSVDMRDLRDTAIVEIGFYQKQ